MPLLPRRIVIVAAVACVVPSVVTSQDPFSNVAREAFGSFAGIQYARITGRFSGTTSLGDFRVPFELVAPVDPSRGNGAVLVEPPHYLLGPVARDLVLGRSFLFDRGFAYAAVGFGNSGRNILDSTANDARIAGASLAPRRAGVPDGGAAANPASTIDEEILIQFVNALTGSAFAREALGPIERRYAIGVSQTSAALLETLHHPQGRGLFDLTLLIIAMWRPPWQSPAFERLKGAFEPLSGAGRVIFVESEGDLLLSEAASFRRVVSLESFRVYELAGAAHGPSPSNPTNGSAVVRALFLRGDAWVRQGTPPPVSVLLEVAPSGAVDPVHGVQTGILRDDDGNARGGVRLPDVAIGRARFVAADVTADLAVERRVRPFRLEGNMVDLACAPRPGATGPRFRSHDDYVEQFTRQVARLVEAGFLLPADAEALRRGAAASKVGEPGACASSLPPSPRPR